MTNELRVGTATLLAALEDSMLDGRLSDGERRALTELLGDSVPLEENLRRVRNRAFEMAYGRAAGQEDAGAVLRWLEGVMRAVDGARAPAEAVRSEAFFSPGDACLKAIVRQLRAAKQSADICVFTLSDDRISDEVLALHKRGVRVRIITDNDKEFDEGSDVGRFREAGIAVAVDRTSAHMHHKFVILDGSCLLNGSYNWTRSAAQCNEENLMLSTAPEFVAAFSRQFEALWHRLSND